MTDPLTRFRLEASTIRRETRERVIVAVTAPQVPAFRRRRDAEAAVSRGRRALDDVRTRMTDGAERMADEARHGLFDLARMDAPHVMRDTLSEASTWTAAQHAAGKVADEAAAVQTIRHGLTHAERDPFACIVAGAVALRAYREGWQTALGTFIDSERGRHRGGWDELDRMATWEGITRGVFPSWVADDLDNADTIAGDYWPADEAA